MSQLSKAQLATENSTSFPNNTTGYITPALLRDFNTNMIDSNVNQTAYTTDSASFDSRIDSLESFSSSIAIDYINQAELNAATASLSASLTTTINTKISNTTFNSFSASVTQSITDLQNGKANLNGGNSFTGSQSIDGNITASGDIFAQSDITASGNIKATGISGSGLAIAGNTILGGNAFDSSSINGFVFVTNPQKFKFGTTTFTDYTASVDAEINGLTTTSSFNTFTQSYKVDSASVDSRLDSLEAFSSSLDATFATDAQLAAVSSALNLAKLETSSFNTFSTSVDSRLDSLEAFSSSLDATFATDAQLNASSSTLQANIDTKLNTSSFNTFSTSVDSRLDSIEGAGYVTAAITASSVITASFDNSSRNLTFTKGDASQFSVNIPDVSGSGGTTNTGSLLVTASAAGNTITFTKGDASTFNVTVAGGTVDTSSFITTGELTGTQFISGALVFTGSARIQISTASFVNIGSGQPQVSLKYDPSASALSYFEVNTNLPQYLNQAVKVGMIATGSLVGGLVKVYIDPSETGSAVDGSTTNGGGLLYASQSTTDWRYVFGYNGNPQTDGTSAFVVQRGLHKLAGNATSIPTGSLSQYPIGTPLYWSGQAQGAITLTRPTNGVVLRLGYIAAIENGANPYVREIWYDPVWEEGETTYSPNLSGSIIISNQPSQLLPNVTASAGSTANIIFNTNSNTATTLVSGSANLFVNPAAPTAGFRRQIGSGSGNIALNASNIPQISSSMVFPINMSNNYFGGNGTSISSRGPISSSAWTISGNSILGTLNIGGTAAANAQAIVAGAIITANNIIGTAAINSPLNNLTQPAQLTNNIIGGALVLTAATSSIAWTGNTTQGTVTFTNQATGSQYSIASGSNGVYGAQNIIGGVLTITASGSADPNDFSGSTYIRHIERNLIAGNSNLVRLDGATTESNTLGSTAIIGNNLTVTGSSASPQFKSTILNHGSAFFGRFNSQDGNKAKSAQTVFAVGTGTSTTARKTGFLVDSGSNTFVEGTFTVSGSTSTTGSITIQSGSGDLYMYGHKMFNYGAFQTNVTNSGSAGVSQSINFEITDTANGVSMVSNSRMTFENAGVYSTTFSAQFQCSSGADTAWVWLKKNGTNVAESATKITMANNTSQTMTVNFVNELVANDYLEIAWQNNSGNAVIIAENASGNVPAIPAVILTSVQVR